MSEICKGKEHRMKPLDRRNFLKNTGSVAATVAAGPIVKTAWGKNASPNGTVRMAVIGIRGRGQTHCAEWSKIANVEVATLCDIDEREFPAALKRMEKLSAKKPKTEVDLRPVPEGVHYDLWLGPAPYRPFNENRFHYNWHWFWDYGCADLGNQGPHQMDIARWGINKHDYPVKAHCCGGFFAFDCDQETPNTQ